MVFYLYYKKKYYILFTHGAIILKLSKNIILPKSNIFLILFFPIHLLITYWHLTLSKQDKILDLCEHW